MWETIKKDPLIKTIVVILIGILAFGFAFNIMFGANNSTMGDMGMSSGYSLGNTLEVIIGLLVKLVIIGILIGVLVWIFRAIGKHTGNSQADRFAWLKNDPLIKNALIIIGAVIILIFILSIFRGISFGGNGENEMMANNYNPNSTITFGLQSFLVLLLKLLIFVSLIGLGYGVIMYLKDSHQGSVSDNGIRKGDTAEAAKCPECNTSLQTNWKCCPKCGSDKAFH